MGPPPLRSLAAGARPCLQNLHSKSEVYVHLEKRAHALRQQLFGYAKGFPGEKAWLKPLKGKELIEYYWPSKHDLPSFHMEQYLQMQALRHAPKPTHPALLSLSRLLGLLILRKPQCHLACLVTSLYKTLFSDDPLRGMVLGDNPLQWTDFLHPHTLLALLEKSLKLRGEEKKFVGFLEEARACNTEQELHAFLKRRVESSLHESLGPPLLFLATKTSFSLPAPCCSYKAEGTAYLCIIASLSSSLFVCPYWDSSAAAAPDPLHQHEQQQGPTQAADRGRCTAHVLSLRAATAGQQQQPQQQQQPIIQRGRRSRAQQQVPQESKPSAAAAADAGVSLSLLSPFRALTVDVSLSPEETEDERLKRQQRRAAAAQQLQQELALDPRLGAYMHAERRFFDPLFKRKRVSFLDRLARGRVKSAVERELRSQVYAHHPDQQVSFPNNKGLLVRRWPSPYH
ncbi:hypothetical protein Esti_001685 [Eimeria stiedai]